jgi:hypothetical protein
VDSANTEFIETESRIAMVFAMGWGRSKWENKTTSIVYPDRLNKSAAESLFIYHFRKSTKF